MCMWCIEMWPLTYYITQETPKEFVFHILSIANFNPWKNLKISCLFVSDSSHDLSIFCGTWWYVMLYYMCAMLTYNICASCWPILYVRHVDLYYMCAMLTYTICASCWPILYVRHVDLYYMCVMLTYTICAPCWPILYVRHVVLYYMCVMLTYTKQSELFGLMIQTNDTD